MRVTLNGKGRSVEPAVELAHDESYLDAARGLSEKLDRPGDELAREATADAEEMRARHDPVPMWAWRRLGRWLIGNYKVRVDEESLRKLRELGKDNTLVWMPSHRSYLDTWVLPDAIAQRGFPPFYVIGGINLDFFPFGQLARRTGLIFIRRDIRDDPVYRFALRRHLADLVRRKADFGWSIEGGRSRTGKLRPPRYGLLRYLASAVEESRERNVLLVPVSIVYDHLPEVAAMAAESRGAVKKSESAKWLVDFARGQSTGHGNVYIDVGEPIPLADRLEELGSEEDGRGHEVERVGLEVCHRINNATPIVPAAAITVGLLAADRALTLDEAIEAVRPLNDYFEYRGVPIASSRRLDNRRLVLETLNDLVRTGAAIRFDGGSEPVWGIGADQHLVAAFYRNSAVHCLVGRAVAELATEVGAEAGGSQDAAWAEADRLRDLLKFDFFFPRKREFLDDMVVEQEIIQSTPDLPRIAPLVLRPFLEAYLVVAENLASLHPGHKLNQDAFMDDCLGIARQWHLQRRLTSAESISLELFKAGLRLARHRDLGGPGGHELADRRDAFVRELRETLDRVERSDRPGTPDEHPVEAGVPAGD